MSDAKGSRADAEETLALGFDAIKFKVGHADVAGDLEAIQAAREISGGKLKVMVDYNQSLDIVSAIARGHILDGEGLVWIEEPTTAEDYQGHASIAAAINTPIQMGENMWGPGDLAKAITAKASDCIMLDVMKIGGVSGWLQAAALAQAGGLRISSHLFPEISAHLLSVTKGSQYLEYQDWVAPILERPLVVTKGLAQTPHEPGSGVRWNEEAVARYLLS
jgi:mandelate racemase